MHTNDRINTGCTDIPSEICTKASAVCTEDTSITVTLKSDTTQCSSLSAQLEKSGTVVSKTPKSFTKVAGKISNNISENIFKDYV